MKFGRSYELHIQGNYGSVGVVLPQGAPLPGKSIVIGFPTTIEMNITHHLFASANACEISLYGLSETNRQLIAYNQFVKSQQYRMSLYAGYVSQQPGGLLVGAPSSLPGIFDGFANVAYTERQGPELVTRINAFDNGDLSTGQPSAFFDENNPYTAQPADIFAKTVKDLVHRLSGGVKFGGVYVDPAQLPLKLARPYTFNGNVWAALQKLANSIRGGGGRVYITNNTCYMVGQDLTIPMSGALPTVRV